MRQVLSFLQHDLGASVGGVPAVSRRAFEERVWNTCFNRGWGFAARSLESKQPLQRACTIMNNFLLKTAEVLRTEHFSGRPYYRFYSGLMVVFELPAEVRRLFSPCGNLLSIFPKLA